MWVLWRGHHWIMGRSSSCRGCTVQSSALFPHEVTSLWVIMRRTHYVYRVGLGTYYHVCTVKLFQSCCQLHLQDRLKNNKVFHTRLLLTLHWLLGRSYWQPVTHVSGGEKNRRNQSKLFKAKRPWGQITASYFQSLHYIKVYQVLFCSYRKLCVFVFCAYWNW